MYFSSRPVLNNLLLIFASILLTFGLVEIVFRSIEYDFSHQSKLFDSTPIYYRQPTVPAGSVFFRKDGPTVWHGNALLQGLKMMGGLDPAYDDNPIATIRYDHLGFRNPDSLHDWGIVVVGDSFVELGYLPYESLFTTLIGTALHTDVKNLGVSHTGLWSYNYFLEAYGKSRSTRLAIMVFFEGNDIRNTEDETQQLHDLETTGIRPYRVPERQTSFIRAIANLAGYKKKKGKEHKRLFRNAFYTAGGKHTPISVSYAVPTSSDLTEQQKKGLEKALLVWAKTANNLEMQPWLVYMPSKRRVLDGFLEFEDKAPEKVRNWQQGDLPDFIAKLCQKTGIEFIDVTPGLAEQTRNGVLTYNPVWDTHLNKEGSMVVADIVSRAIRARSSKLFDKP